MKALRLSALEERAADLIRAHSPEQHAFLCGYDELVQILDASSF
ncbi:MAG TPA: hypothetical protein VFL93_05440 [Longimicrobiaceae bacterium]|nr:hypothetical protein [Longimicrobiaceae bacterium]